MCKYFEEVITCIMVYFDLMNETNVKLDVVKTSIPRQKKLLNFLDFQEHAAVVLYIIL